jgi:hypothetical protein
MALRSRYLEFLSKYEVEQVPSEPLLEAHANLVANPGLHL